MWPQSTLEEVRAAQQRADAGDPDFTWQVDPSWRLIGKYSDTPTDIANDDASRFFAEEATSFQKQGTARNGDIVAALIDGEEATVKRFERTTDGVTLHPANEAYEPVAYSKDLAVLGVVVAVLRRL